MKTITFEQIINPVIERARRRAAQAAARGPRRSIAWLLIFLFLFTPVTPRLLRANVNPSERTATPAAATAAAQTTETFVVFGPRNFTREAGAPTNVVAPFTLPADAVAPFSVQLVNGDADGSNRVSSADIKLNGAALFTSSSFNQTVGTLNKSVTLSASNTLEVKLKSSPGSFLTITFTATRTASPQAALTSVAPARATQGQTLNVTLHGTNTHWVAGQTHASLGGEVSVGGAAPGALGPVTVTDANTAVAEVMVSPTAALDPRAARVVTQIGGEEESVVKAEAFTVSAATVPGSSASVVSTVAGGAGLQGYADGAGPQARFRRLTGVAVGADETIYVADTGNQRIRVVRNQPDSSGAPVWVVSTLAGDGQAGYVDGPGGSARFTNPQGIAVDSSGVVYVADTANNRIRRIAPDGTVTTLAGDGTPGLQDGTGTGARFNAPQGVAVDNQGNVYVADTGNSSVRVINPSGEVRTLSGDGTVGSNDSPSARFDGLMGVATDGASVYVYLSDTGNHRIRRLDPSGAVITVAGAERGFADGTASQARFAEPSGIATDGSGKLVVADAVNSLVRLVDPALAANNSPQAVWTIAGTSDRGLTNGAGDIARFLTPRGVAVSPSSAIIVADTGNQVLRRILLPPVITDLAPPSARLGDTITINGARFDGRAAARNTVRFTRSAQAGGGQTPAQVTAATRTQLTVVVPADAATGPVTVETEGGTAVSPSDFVISAYPAPVIGDFTPKHGPVGTEVTLTGTALMVTESDPSVTFAGANGARLPALVKSATATEVRVLVPNAALSGLIELTNAGGTATTPGMFTVDALQDFTLTIAPSTATAVQGSAATYVLYLTSGQDEFSQLATLTAAGLPAGATASFDPAQITAGASSVLTLQLAGTLAPGSYPFTVRAAANVEGRDVTKTAGATLNVIAGGQTTLSGRVLSTDKEPIIGAIVSLDGRTATTDAAGAFLLSGITAGAARPLMVDGRTASAPNRTYPIILEPAKIVAGQANVVPYTFYLPPIDTQYEVDVVPNQNTVAANPRVPNLTMTIPPGANLRNRDGSPVARVSITPLAIDRTPAPLPTTVSTALVYTSQPGGAKPDPGVEIPVIYPNLMGANPGQQVNLFAFNHDTVDWYIYGTGRVSSDGRTIVPNINPSTGKSYGLRDFSWHFPSAAGPGGNPGKPDDCPINRGGSPVDYSTGVKIEKATDIMFGGARGGLLLARTYTSDLSRRNISGSFGVGWKGTYDIRLTGTFQVGGAGRLVDDEQESGDLYNYSGTAPDGALLFTSTGSVSQIGDVLRKLADGTYEYRFKNGGNMRFNSAGRLTSLSDNNGNTTTLTYTGANLTRVTDAVGRSITLAYDGSNRVTSATDALNKTWRYTYETGLLTTVTNPLGYVVRYGYEGFPSALTSVKDKRGALIKQINYDGSGRVIRQKFADGGAEQYAYELSGGVVTLTTVTDPKGRRRSMRFNAAGYTIGTTDELGQSAVISRDLGTNQSLSTSGPCGCSESARQYDARGNVAAETNRAGETVRAEYDPATNRITKFTNRLGRSVSFTYDSRGNLLTSTNPLGQTTVYGYDGFGQRTSVTDPLGHTTRTEYDQYGHPTAKVDALGHRMTIEYDAMGRATATVDALGRRDTREYDDLGRVTSTTDAAGATTGLTYDPNGNLLTITDHLGRRTTFTYDGKNRRDSVKDALGRTARTQYDANDQVVAEISPTGRVVRYTYDERNQISTITDPRGGLVRYKHDFIGNLLSLTDPRGNVYTFSYDSLYRSTGMRDPLGREARQGYDAANNVNERVDRRGRRTVITYDDADRPTRIAYADAVVNYTYDAASRLERIEDSQGGALDLGYDDANRKLTETTPAGVVRYGYNDADQVTSMTAADRAPVGYHYDTAGRLDRITQGAETFTYRYDDLSRLAGLERPNGVKTTYDYDEVSRLKQIAHANAAGQAVEDLRFVYNADDEIESITSLSAASLLPASRSAGPADAANRIAQFGQATYSFDEQGMTTAKTDAQGTTTYQWDARGRMTQATLPGGQTVQYGYDALGRMATRTAGGTTTTSLYDGSEVVLDRASDGAQVDYLNGPGMDDKLRQSRAATGPLYFLQDQLGSTVALTDAAGGVAERMSYEPFGGGGASALTRFTYTGRERDAQTNLMYYRARWYDPAQGRFLSEDPAGFAGGINKYAYVSNNPVSKNDPLGLYETDVHFYLTYYLARQTGCFTQKEARQIAGADEGTDTDPHTRPGARSLDPVTPEGQRQRDRNAHFHGLTDDQTRAQDLSNLMNSAMQGSRAERLTNFGRYMHYFQDTFSHRDYHDPAIGHGLAGHLPDKTNQDVEKAMDMARQSFEQLKDFARKLKGCKCEGADSNPDWKKVRQFMEADGGGFWDVINDQQLDNKRRILSDPRGRPLPRM
ncbi:MAG TPA: RHS repeat-associated core domain-containing protein [Pyrinomonadaceae bacterium]|nr:RHS repeat-associated core domain-containing protein [Pyrinomonadaceae bacterium]